MQVAGRVVLMLGGERWAAMRIGLVSFLLLALATLLLIADLPGAWPAFAFAALFGTANGMNTIVRATIVPELFSREGYASVSGALAAASSIAKAAAPFAAAVLWQASGGYQSVLMAAFAVVVVSCAAFLVAGMLPVRRWLGP